MRSLKQILLSASLLSFALASCTSPNNPDVPQDTDPFDSVKAVVMDRVLHAGYTPDKDADSRDESANYYIALSDCEGGVDENMGDLYPAEPNGTIVFLDLYAAESPDPDNAILPEGEYKITSTYKDHCANAEYTFIRTLQENGEVSHFLPSEGTATVSIEDGNYVIECKFMDADHNLYKSTYSGPIEFTNLGSGSAETELPQMDSPVNSTFKEMIITAYGGDDDYHRFTLMLYDGDLSADGQQIINGVVLSVDMFTPAPGSDEIFIHDGTYTACTSEDFVPMTYQPGGYMVMFGQTITYGTFMADLRNGQQLLYGFVEKGGITINRSGDKYSLSVDLTTTKGVSIKGEYPMGNVTVIDKRPVEPAGDWLSTLTHDLNLVYSNDSYAYVNRYDQYKDPISWEYYDITNFDLVVDDMANDDSFQLRLLAPKGQQTPVGTYTVADMSKDLASQPYTFIPGRSDGTTPILHDTWAWYINISGVVSHRAPGKEGKIEITENADKTYTILFELKDDAEPQNTIRTQWTGELNFKN